MPYLGVKPADEFTSKDLNGEELILDADADTTITADTDDTIDIRIAGADDFQFTANTFTAQSGSTIVGHLNATGDTAASDNAAIGYTAAEGLILTGQGSTNDITIKNDADADVIKIATGTTNVEVVGNLTVGGGIIFDDETLDIYDEGTFSPTLQPYDTNFDAISYDSLRIGRYVIIGHICHFEITMRTDSITVGSGSGTMSIESLPVAAYNASNHYRLFPVQRLAGMTGEYPNIGLMPDERTFMRLYYDGGLSGTAKSDSQPADFGTGADENWLITSGSYETQ